MDIQNARSLQYNTVYRRFLLFWKRGMLPEPQVSRLKRIIPKKKDIHFIMANGQHITRSVGFAIIYVGKAFTTDEVVFAQKGDLQLLGARTFGRA